ncbi:MAG: FecR family protein [Pseudonocardiaceae bacterium]
MTRKRGVGSARESSAYPSPRERASADGGIPRPGADVGARRRIALHGGRRRIELLAGEAEFVVRADARRPFVVEAGAVRIETLGTDFLVRRDAEGTTVAVVESAVQVHHARGDGAETVRAGEQIRCDDRRLGAVRPADLARSTAWRRGKLVFESTPLAEVVAEINRHRPGHVALMSSELRTHRVSGVFAIDRIDTVLAVISETLPVRSQSVAGRYVVLY